MLIAFSTLACPDWSWRTILERGAEYGYDGVEVRLIEQQTDLLSRPEFAPDQLAQRRRELESHRFRVAGLASSAKFDDPDPAARKAQVETAKAYVNLAKELGAEFVRVFGDVLPPERDARETTLANIAECLQQIGEHAGPTGVKVILETHGDFADSLLAVDLLKRVGSEAVGVLWDTHHPWRFCGEPLAETAERLKPWLWHTHWKDSVLQPVKTVTEEMRKAEEEAARLMGGHRPADYVLQGAGEFPTRDCLQVLKDLDYQGWYSYEWEKAWHPEIEPPEVALPPFPGYLKDTLRSL